ncbi:FAD binding domain-containing protein [Propylenella binzhouense]|uniref:Xanthine dehydrogenase family protein subunit M n=1 Tax=Propylenella binzhouense TaxID=2555902 RepID=A0A964T4L4_9HYPH|nr:xanthine dehydrogenase family protein subunit M [Propylenella binzhouense]
MNPFRYRTAADPDAAIGAALGGATFIAGGTDLIQLMQEGIAAPDLLMDINGIGYSGVASDLDGIRIGALTRLAEVADDPTVRARFPLVREAIESTASGQVRNMATVGGNLLQKTRCLYFRDRAAPCNKRAPGTGCSAFEGQNRINAVLGASAHCIATHPSDLAVALVAADAEVILRGPAGERTVLLESFYRLPEDRPDIETVLEPGELIVGVWLPIAAAARRSRYVKVRDRASFEWALASCAAAIATDGGEVLEARLAVGGVATKPWRLARSEAALVGRPFGPGAIREAAALAAEGAEPRGRNAYKVPLLVATVERTLMELRGAG